MPPGNNLNPYPEGCGIFVSLKGLISRTVNYVEKMDISKFWIGCVRGNSGCERGVSCPQITFYY
jgi:hypothetical protein